MESAENNAQFRFHTTRWTIVLHAARNSGKAGNEQGREALEQLCQSYWYPLYALARREGLEPESAEDAAQAFFADLLEKATIAKVDPARGRFRAYLRTAFKNFLSTQRRHAKAEKRGGGRRVLSLDPGLAEERYSAASGSAMDPEAIFDRAWALTLIEHVVDDLQASYEDRGRAAWFDALRAGLMGEAALPSHAQIAQDLGTSAGAVKLAAHRLRERFRQALLEAVADTLDEPAAGSGATDDRQAELAVLFSALGGG